MPAETPSGISAPWDAQLDQSPMGHPVGPMRNGMPHVMPNGTDAQRDPQWGIQGDTQWDRRPGGRCGAGTVGASLLRDGDALLEEAMEVGLSGAGSFRPSGSFSSPFSREE